MEPLWLFVASGRHLLRNLNHVKTNSFDSKHIDSLFPSFLSAGKVVAVMHGANAPMMKVRTAELQKRADRADQSVLFFAGRC